MTSNTWQMPSILRSWSTLMRPTFKKIKQLILELTEHLIQFIYANNSGPFHYDDGSRMLRILSDLQGGEPHHQLAGIFCRQARQGV